MFIKRPALRVVLLFTTGILLASIVNVPLVLVYLPCLSGVIGLLCITRKYSESTSYRTFLLFIVIMLGYLSQGLFKLDQIERRLNPNVIDEKVKVFGKVQSEANLKNDRLNFVFSVDSIYRQGKREFDRRQVIVLVKVKNIRPKLKFIHYRAHLSLDATLDQFPTPHNPGEFDYGKYLELNDISGVIRATDIGLIDTVNVNDLETWLHQFQQTLYHSLNTLHSKAHAGFLKGIVLGYREDLADDVKQSFINTGTIHILAVSGSNVAFVTLVFFSLFGFFRLPRMVIALITSMCLLLYMYVSGLSASVIRATIMGMVFLLSTCFERKSDIYNSISVSALILLLWNSNNLFDVGFQLSYAAVLSIIYFYPKLVLLIKMIPERFEEIRGVDSVLKLFAVSFAAQLGTLPFTAYYFGRVSIISLLANLLVVPISGLNTIIGVIEIILLPLSSHLASLYAGVNDFLVWFLLGFVKKAASVSFAYFETPAISVTLVLSYYSIVLGAFTIQRRTVKYFTLIFLLGANFLLYKDLLTTTKSFWKSTMLDVGQGDALFLDFSEGYHVLIDAGPATRFMNAGERVVVPYLKRNGIKEIHYAVITHPHDDHFGGMKSVAQNMKIDTIVIPESEQYSSSFSRLLDTLCMNGTILKKVSFGNQLFIGENARAYIINPALHRKDRNLNNKSVVIKVVYGRTAILLCGDAEDKVEELMVQRYGKLLQSNVIKVGHHGSITSSTLSFLQNVMPEVALISVGKGNKFGHPSPLILKRFEHLGIDVHRTDIVHAVVLLSNGEKMIESRWR